MTDELVERLQRYGAKQMTKRYAPKHEMLVAVMTSMGWVEVEEELQEYLEALEHCGLEIREKQS
jgi:hypothetical protein